ncbi:hypothetical protein EB796_021632 [Bugula neritina]|uniref:Uncharacterized protein n=1 Tax=Bugula neritina TaxID=10212 RepID=A0A7J7J1J6_BUGNE|nr:hypothetical protein EB796_021632 [Bugula neritina]
MHYAKCNQVLVMYSALSTSECVIEVYPEITSTLEMQPTCLLLSVAIFIWSACVCTGFPIFNNPRLYNCDKSSDRDLYYLCMTLTEMMDADREKYNNPYQRQWESLYFSGRNTNQPNYLARYKIYRFSNLKVKPLGTMYKKVILIVATFVTIGSILAAPMFEDSSSTIYERLDRVRQLCLNAEIDFCDATLCEILFHLKVLHHILPESAKRAGPKNNKPKLSPYGEITSMRFGRKKKKQFIAAAHPKSN